MELIKSFDYHDKQWEKYIPFLLPPSEKKLYKHDEWDSKFGNINKIKSDSIAHVIFQVTHNNVVTDFFLIGRHNTIHRTSNQIWKKKYEIVQGHPKIYRRHQDTTKNILLFERWERVVWEMFIVNPRFKQLNFRKNNNLLNLKITFTIWYKTKF